MTRRRAPETEGENASVERKGAAGGRARAKALSAERRKEIGRDAYLAGAVATVTARVSDLSREQVERLRAALGGAVC